MFAKILTFIFSKFPKQQRLAWIRKLAQVPELCDDPGFKIKIAETKNELEQAYKLLHDCYVRQTLMEPDPTRLRCTFFSSLPETKTVIVCYGGEVLGTVTLIKDSRHGLPSDKEFPYENVDLRQQDDRLMEVSAKGVSTKFRKTNHAVSLLFMKYLYHYAKISKCTKIVCTVHPRAQDFYEAIWGFERRGKIVQYPFVNGALAIHMGMSLSQKAKLKLIALFGTNCRKKNLPLWVLKADPRFHYPLNSEGQILDPVLKPDTIEYLFKKRINCLSTFSPIERTHVSRRDCS